MINFDSFTDEHFSKLASIYESALSQMGDYHTYDTKVVAMKAVFVAAESLVSDQDRAGITIRKPVKLYDDATYSERYMKAMNTLTEVDA